MFGIGKLIGGALNAVGLGKIAPFISMAINVMTGNVAGLVTDVMGLMSNIKGLGFLNKVAQFAPLGGFSSGGMGGFAGIGNFLSQTKIGGFLSNLSSTISNANPAFKTISNMLKTAEDFYQNTSVLQTSRTNAQWSQLYGSSARA